MQQDEDKTLYATMRPARGGRSLVTLSTYEERQEALRNTAMMEDEVNHRASRLYRNDNSQVNNNTITAAAAAPPTTTTSTTATTTQFNMPPPPPQFASSPPQQRNSTNNNNNSTATPLKHNIKSLAPTMNPKPPSSPVPDYDNVEIRTKSTATATATPTKSTTSTTNNNRPSYGYATPNVVTNGAATTTNGANRRTMRLGTVTIGEYEQPQQRKEPSKFDFVGTPKRNGGTNGLSADESLHTELQNTLTRSKLKKSAEPLEHQSNCPLRSSYENYENVARKLHSVSLNESGGVGAAATAAAATAATQRNSIMPMVTNGILKNGNSSRNGLGNGLSSNGNGNLTKNSDKTITFGN